MNRTSTPARLLGSFGAIVGIVTDGAAAAAAAPLPAAFKAPPAQPAATVPVAVTVQPSKIDPFFEVRTPDRNFGAAKLPGGISITPLARGMYGVREFTAIINPPHSTIFAVGAAHSQPIETETSDAAFATMIDVTVSCDHRVIDGALGAKLLGTLRRLLQDPVTVLV